MVVAGGCIAAGIWQLQRAQSGNTLSWVYAIQWPAFAAVAGIAWWQLLHDDPDEIRKRRVEDHVAWEASHDTDPVALAIARQADRQSPETRRYNEYLRELAQERERSS